MTTKTPKELISEVMTPNTRGIEELKKEWYMKGFTDGVNEYEKALTQPNNPK